MKRIVFYLLTFVLVIPVVRAQVAISDDGSQPDASAMLDVKSIDKGWLIPRMTTTQRDAISSPATGLEIYNLTDGCKQVYYDGVWNNVWCSCMANITAHPADSAIEANADASFSVTATGTGLTYQWQVNTGGSWSNISNGGSNPTYSGATTTTLSLTNVPFSCNNYSYRCAVSGCPPSVTSSAAYLIINPYSAGTVFCIPGGSDVVNVITGTGKTWMDRNLGALRVATVSDDHNAYGSLYQWGRFSDGHQCINWISTTTSDGEEQNHETTVLSTSDDPGHDDFIVYNGDWRSPGNDNLWQGVSGTNNPCPSGYRIPTQAEFEAEVTSWGVGNDNSSGAYNSPLKLPAGGGFRFAGDNGNLWFVGDYGYYWTSDISSVSAISLRINLSSASCASTIRGNGMSVRCIKD